MTMEFERQRFSVVVVMDHFLPGEQAGGPITTIKNLLSGDASNEFLIVTSNRDLDGTLYVDVLVGEVQGVAGCAVLYVSDLTPRSIVRACRRFGARVVYLNSFFSPVSVSFLSAKRLGYWSEGSVALAPRGEFSIGAMRHHFLRKRMYLRMFKFANIGREIDFYHSSTDVEAAELRTWLGGVDVQVAEDPIVVHSRDLALGASLSREGEGREDRIVFVSRIVPKKNLLGALEIVGGLPGPFLFRIFGFIEDDAYFRECMDWAKANLNGDQVVEYGGPLARELVSQVFADSDVFLFPTQGENFGHVIPEALAAGCPVVVSDRTPWFDFGSEGVGSVVPFGATAEFAEAVSAILSLTGAARSEMRERCLAYARRVASDDGIKVRNGQLLGRLLALAKN